MTIKTKSTVLLLSSLMLGACSKPNDTFNDIQNKIQNTQTHAQNNMHTLNKATQNSPQWVGIYTGILPCADCEGIATTFELKADYHYSLSEKYLGKQVSSFHIQGAFHFDPKNPSLIILDTHGQNRKFFVDDHFIEMRDIKTGQEINPRFNYKLEKN